ncbi:MAG: hypothetical protein E7474_10640 [Ruminococcaceae bacterium]|nr:hypothetical protein [Oscillospiraceae bacterium]
MAQNDLNDMPAFITTKSKMAANLNRVIDLYNLGQINESQLVSQIAVWHKNSREMLTSDGKVPSPGLVKLIGKRRSMVLAAVLAQISE